MRDQKKDFARQWHEAKPVMLSVSNSDTDVFAVVLS